MRLYDIIFSYTFSYTFYIIFIYYYTFLKQCFIIFENNMRAIFSSSNYTIFVFFKYLILFKKIDSSSYVKFTLFQKSMCIYI